MRTAGQLATAINRSYSLSLFLHHTGIGDSFANVLSIPGVQAEWIGYDDGGMWYWTWDGLWFAPSQQGLGEILSRKLYDSKETPSAADFSDDVKVGFIGTGLPF